MVGFVLRPNFQEPTFLFCERMNWWPCHLLNSPTVQYFQAPQFVGGCCLLLGSIVINRTFHFQKVFILSQSSYTTTTQIFRGPRKTVTSSYFTGLFFCRRVKITNFYVIFSTKPASHHKLKAPISHQSLNISCYWPKLRSVVSKILQKQSLDLQVNSRRIE